MRVAFDEVKNTIKQALLNLGVTETEAEICAQIHTESSADGVESHGLNRIPRFADYVKKDGSIYLENRNLSVLKAL